MSQQVLAYLLLSRNKKENADVGFNTLFIHYFGSKDFNYVLRYLYLHEEYEGALLEPRLIFLAQFAASIAKMIESHSCPLNYLLSIATDASSLAVAASAAKTTPTCTPNTPSLKYQRK